MKKLCLPSLLLPCIFSLALSVTASSQQTPGTPPGSVPTPLLSPKPAEDWSSIQLDESALGRMSYAVIGRKEEPDFTREIVRIQWRVADPIDLFVILPHAAHDAPKPPAILYLYGYPADTDRFYDEGWCKRATRSGFAAIGFVSAVTGQRFSNRPFKDWFVSELQEALGESTHDVQMIVNYLVRRGDIDTTSIGMFGQGSGGAIGILAAAADPRIGALDVLDPWGDWPEWLKTSPEILDSERPTYLEPGFLARVANLDPLVYLAALKARKFRLQQVMDEANTPPAVKQKLAQAIADPRQLVEYRDERAHLAVYRVDGIAGWLEHQLRPLPPPQ